MKKNHLAEQAYFEKKTGWFRYKNPSSYTWRTSPNMLSMLKLMAKKEDCYKCEILEEAIKEYFERHFCDELAKNASGSQLAAFYSDVYGLQEVKA